MVKYEASVEWICESAAVVRLHEGQGVLGDPYVWCCTLAAEGETAVLKGVLKAPPNGGLAAVTRRLREWGFKHRSYERRCGGGWRMVTKEN